MSIILYPALDFEISGMPFIQVILDIHTRCDNLIPGMAM
jgi:hypothetical protein